VLYDSNHLVFELSFKVHFLNVGDGDCTILELPDDTIMVVDVRNARIRSYDARSGLENPINYLEKKLKVSSIFRYVQTHPDMDHLDGFYDLRNKYTFTNFWDTNNNKPKPDEFLRGYREIDWNTYQKIRSEEDTKFRTRSLDPIGLKGGKFPYEIYVINPSIELVKKANENEDWNLLSYVIVIIYEGFKLMLSGDASDEAWEDIYKWAMTNSDAKNLVSDVIVFKAAHHGRNSSYCGVNMLNLMKPQKIVISKGTVPGEQSAYGKYYSWSGGADNMFLTSKGTIIIDYYDIKNRKYSIYYA